MNFWFYLLTWRISVRFQWGQLNMVKSIGKHFLKTRQTKPVLGLWMQKNALQVQALDSW